MLVYLEEQTLVFEKRNAPLKHALSRAPLTNAREVMERVGDLLFRMAESEIEYIQPRP